jgi:hypothetical protein
VHVRAVSQRRRPKTFLRTRGSFVKDVNLRLTVKTRRAETPNACVKVTRVKTPFVKICKPSAARFVNECQIWQSAEGGSVCQRLATVAGGWEGSIEGTGHRGTWLRRTWPHNLRFHSNLILTLRPWRCFYRHCGFCASKFDAVLWPALIGFSLMWATVGRSWFQWLLFEIKGASSILNSMHSNFVVYYAISMKKMPEIYPTTNEWYLRMHHKFTMHPRSVQC